MPAQSWVVVRDLRPAKPKISPGSWQEKLANNILAEPDFTLDQLRTPGTGYLNAPSAAAESEPSGAWLVWVSSHRTDRAMRDGAEDSHSVGDSLWWGPAQQLWERHPHPIATELVATALWAGPFPWQRTRSTEEAATEETDLIFWTGSQTCRGLCPLCRGRVTLSSFRKRFLISQRSRAFPAFPQLVICSKYRVPHTCMPNKTRQNSRKEKHNLANGSYFILFI